MRLKNHPIIISSKGAVAADTDELCDHSSRLNY